MKISKICPVGIQALILEILHIQSQRFFIFQNLRLHLDNPFQIRLTTSQILNPESPPCNFWCFYKGITEEGLYHFRVELENSLFFGKTLVLLDTKIEAPSLLEATNDLIFMVERV